MAKLDIDSIAPIAVGIGVAIITVAILTLVLATMAPATYATHTYYPNHTFTANSTNLPVLGRGFESIVGVYNDTTQEQNPGVLDTDWHYYTNNNTLLLLTPPGVDENSTNNFKNAAIKSVNYYYTAMTNATYVTEKGLAAMMSFADWFGILVVVVIAVIILALVMLLRGRGGES